MEMRVAPADKPTWEEHAAAAGAVGLLLFTLFKGLVVAPHDWAVAHYLIDYSHGFTKRGFLGTLLLPLLSGKSGQAGRAIIIQFSFVLMAVFVLLAARAAVSLALAPAPTRSEAKGNRAAAFLFCTSPFIWHAGICLGYLDIVVASLALLAVANGNGRLGRFVPLAVLALLAHEAAALLVVPLMLLFPLDLRQRGWVDRQSAGRVLTVLFAFGVLAAFLFYSPPWPGFREEAIRTGFAHSHWIGVLNELLRVPFAQSLQRVMQTPGLWGIYRGGLLVYMLPSWMMVSLGLWTLWTRAPLLRTGLCWSVIFGVAALSSAVMVLFAFDFSRLFALTNLQAFLAYGLLQRKLNELPPVESPSSLRPGKALLVGAWVVVAANVLMPARFTFLQELPRFWPRDFDRFLPDPLGALISTLMTG